MLVFWSYYNVVRIYSGTHNFFVLEAVKSVGGLIQEGFFNFLSF